MALNAKGELNAESRLGASGATNVTDWVTGTDYLAGDVVMESLALYLCSADHTASAAFATDAANWLAVGASAFIGTDGTSAGSEGSAPAAAQDEQNRLLRGDGTWGIALPLWTVSTIYKAGDAIIADPPNYGVYVAVADHTSDASLFANDSAQWVLISVAETSADFTGTDGTVDGTTGDVPDPAATDNNKYLLSDGTWGRPYACVTIQDLSTDQSTSVDWLTLNTEVFLDGSGGAGTGTNGAVIEDNGGTYITHNFPTDSRLTLKAGFRYKLTNNVHACDETGTNNYLSASNWTNDGVTSFGSRAYTALDNDPRQTWHTPGFYVVDLTAETVDQTWWVMVTDIGAPGESAPGSFISAELIPY